MRDQAANLREKINRNPNAKTAKTIAVISGKGGVGKSNVALNFAIGLLRAHKRVLLFDLDVGMGNIDILIGGQPDQTVLDMLSRNLTIDRIITKGPNNLDYIAGGSSLNDIVNVDQRKMDYFLAQLQQLVPWYDYIIFDMGAGISNANSAFILAADECMVITNPEPTAITDAYGMMKYVLNKQPNMPIYVVMNRSHKMKQGSKALVRLQHVACQFLNVRIHPMGLLPEDSVVQKSVIRQIPYMLLNNHAAVSKAMVKLTTDYLRDSDNHRQSVSLFIQKVKQFLTDRR